jgi:flagellin-like hook-associated protein FlgL
MDISLTAGMYNSVLALQDNASLFNTTQTDLATGKAVNSALDDPLRYFASQNDLFQADQLTTLKSSMNEALQTIQAANNGITGITALVKQAIALAQSSAATSNTTTQSSLNTQLTALVSQIDSMAGDAGYGGTDLINNSATTLTVNFNTTNGSKIVITGVDATSTGLNITGLDISTSGGATAAQTALSAALTTLQTDAQTLSSSNAIIQARISFTSSMINTLQQGSDNLTLADMNKEGANMLALQTQQALAINSLRIASQSSQSVLRLFQ